MAQVIGKVFAKFDEVTGTTAKGDWIRGGCVLLVDNGVNVAVSAFGEDKVGLVRALKIGETAIVEYYPESREFGGRWYTDLRIKSIQVPQRP